MKYREAALTTYTFSQATESAKSYALDATVVSLTDEDITYNQIEEDVKKELDAGKTYINLILAPDADEIHLMQYIPDFKKQTMGV